QGYIKMKQGKEKQYAVGGPCRVQPGEPGCCPAHPTSPTSRPQPTAGHRRNRRGGHGPGCARGRRESGPCRVLLEHTHLAEVALAARVQRYGGPGAVL